MNGRDWQRRDSPPATLIGTCNELTVTWSCQCQFEHAETLTLLSSSQFPAVTMSSRTLTMTISLLVLLLSRSASPCVSVPGFGPGQTENRDGLQGGDIFGFGNSPDYGFEGFEEVGLGFEFGEGFSHDGEEVPVYQRRGGEEERYKILLNKRGEEKERNFDYGF